MALATVPARTPESVQAYLDPDQFKSIPDLLDKLFGKFAAGWPNDDRAPAALESRVASLEALKDWKSVRVTLEQLAEKYPNSEAGKKAKLKLKKK
mgnify:CR=1 FL=1